MTRIFLSIWLAALALATTLIFVLSSSYPGPEVRYPPDFEHLLESDIVFIGSSLTEHAFPHQVPRNGRLGDRRRSTILSTGQIPEWLTTRLLGDAIDAGVETIFVEINAYGHRYAALTGPAFLEPPERWLRHLGVRLSTQVRILLGLGERRHWVVKEGSRRDRKTLNPKRLGSRHYYRFRLTGPQHPEELEARLNDAGNAGVEVIFFSPPRPESVVRAMGEEHYLEMQAHLRELATQWGVALWLPEEAWPDDHFMDVMAHANPRGRRRFQAELAEWYGDRH